MLDWIFEGIVDWVSGIVSDLMDAVSGLFLNALGTDMTAMEEYFPFVAKAYVIMQYTGWAILFLVTVWQLFRIFGGPVTDAENPWSLIGRSSIFALLIGYAKPIFLIVLDIATAPYTALMDITMTAEDFTFGGVENALRNGLVLFVSDISGVGAILLTILMIALGWNYFKLLLETVERYIVVGVLFYTSPLSYSLGASKATSNVFRSWCRMVGTQLFLLVMNVWFLRGFASAMGQYIGSGGTLSSGYGNIFLWMFCALAFLKTAQKFDSYLASIGLNVAQTGGNMAAELVSAAHVISGVGSSVKSAGNVFKGGSSATGTGAASAGFATGFASKFKGNSYVRDAVVSGGTRMGMGGSIGFVGRAFGGMAARNGATLNSDSIASVASRTSDVSGSIGGSIADRSLGNYLPHIAGHKLTNTQIAGGRISTTATTPDGKTASIEMYSADQYEKPDVPHAVVTATDGSQWYQMASGSGADFLYSAPEFTGDISESGKVSETFPDAKDGTILRTADDGVIEASPPGDTSFLYSGAVYSEPEGAYSVVTDNEGNMWYQMSADDINDGSALPPSYLNDNSSFIGGDEGVSYTDVADGVVEASGADGSSMLYNSELYAEPEGEHSVVTDDDGNTWYQMSPTDAPPQFTGDNGVSFPEMPEGTEFYQNGNGIVETTTSGGEGSMLYNSTMFAEPEGEHSIVTADDGSSWYQLSSTDLANGTVSAPEYIGNMHDIPNGDVNFPEMPEGTTYSSAGAGIVEATGEPGNNTLWYNSANYEEPEAPHTIMQASNGVDWYAMQPHADSPEFERGSDAIDYNRAQFQAFMPGYEQSVATVDGSNRSDGYFEVRNRDGSGTMFYDTARYAPPRGDYQVFEDAKGSQWYAIRGSAAVERVPVYTKDGLPVYEDSDTLKTKTVETVRYKTTPSKYKEPKRRGKTEIKTPKRKR